MTNEELVEAIQSGHDVQDNLQQLYDQNKRLMYKWIRPYTSYADQEDLMQEAFFGLHEAVRHFASDKGLKFTTYLFSWVKQRACRYCDNNVRTVRIPVYFLSLINRYEKFCLDYHLNNGIKPDAKEICESLDITEDQLKLIKRLSINKDVASLDVMIPDTDLSLAECIPDDFDLEQTVTDKEADQTDSRMLWECVSMLPDRQQNIILMIFRDNLSLKEVAESYGVSRQRVFQIENSGLKTLRNVPELKQAALDRGMKYDPDSQNRLTKQDSGGIRKTWMYKKS